MQGVLWGSESRNLGALLVGVGGWRRSWQHGAVTLFGADLRGDLAVGRLIGGLDEHGLSQFLSRWHGNLLDLVQLLQHARRQE